MEAYRTQNTPLLQAILGVRVVASLLGHSRLETLCSRAIAQKGQWGQYLGQVARRPGRRGLDRSDPCKEHKTVPGWMTIL